MKFEKNAADNVYYSINRLEAQVSMVNRLQFNLINDKDLNRLSDITIRYLFMNITQWLQT